MFEVITTSSQLLKVQLVNRNWPLGLCIEDAFMRKTMIEKLKIPLMLSLFLFLLLIKFEFAIFLWPLITLIYGWFSENRTSSLILGILPYIFSFLYIVLILGALYMSDEPRLIELTIYWMILSLIGGTIGYLAAWKTRMSLMLAIGFLILWNVVVYSGLD